MPIFRRETRNKLIVGFMLKNNANNPDLYKIRIPNQQPRFLLI